MGNFGGSDLMSDSQILGSIGPEHYQGHTKSTTASGFGGGGKTDLRSSYNQGGVFAELGFTQEQPKQHGYGKQGTYRSDMIKEFDQQVQSQGFSHHQGNYCYS